MNRNAQIKFYVYLVLLIGAIASMLVLRDRYLKSTTVEIRDLAEILQTDTLRVATDMSSNSFFLIGDELSGVQYELINGFAEELGINVIIEPQLNIEKSFEALREGKIDIVARPIPVTAELRSSYYFVEPFFVTRQVLVQHTPTAGDTIGPLRNQLLLAGETIYLPASSLAHYRINNLIKEIGDTIYTVNDGTSSYVDLMKAVSERKIKYTVVDQHIAQRMASKIDSLDVTTPISFTQLQAWVVNPKSKELCNRLDQYFQDLKKSGKLDRLIKKYIKPQPQKK